MRDVDQLLTPPTETARRALEVARQWCSPALVNHSLRSWAWAASLADSLDLDVDAELLYVGAVLHDVGIAPLFDSHERPFEDAGGAVGWTFAAGAGWSERRRQRLNEVIQRHMWVSVDADADPEGYLLEAATSLDVAHADAQLWDPTFVAEVVARLPRLGFGAEFDAAIRAQAARKPSSAAARLAASHRILDGDAAWAGESGA